MNFENNFKNINIEKLFVVLGLIFGCLFIYIVPPFQSPDEDSHFKKAYSISKLEFYRTKENNNIGFHIPNDMNNYINEKLTKMGNLEYKYTYADLYFDQLLSNDLSNTAIYNYSTTNTTPIAHIVPSIGIILAKLFSPIFINGSPSTAFMLTFARFTSLCFYLLIGYFAIKISPAFKKSMCAILLMPMSLFLGSMVTYDNLLLVTVLMSISLILKLIYENKFMFDKKMIILFSIIGYILLNIKTIYFPILALLLFVPKNKFKDNKKIKTYLLILGIILLFTILLKIPNYIVPMEGSKYAGKQISYICSHPFAFLKTIITNFLGQFYTQIYWMIGTFGLLDTYMPPLFALITFINLLIVFIADGITEKIIINGKMKFIAIMYIAFGVAAMYAAMYISWTPEITGIVGGNVITGVQGRYFIPLLIAIPMLFSIKNINKKGKIYKCLDNYFSKFVMILVISLCISIITCLTRYWI